MKATPPVIECRNVSKTFVVSDGGSFWKLVLRRNPDRVFVALQDVTLNVPKGEFFGLLGRNGAGKSTFLRTVGGVYAPSSGVVVVGEALSGMYELGMAGNDLLTGRGFAKRWLSLSGTAGRRASDLLEEISDFSEVGEYFDKPIYTYSSGMKARLFFSVATSLPGQIYLIDEVLAVGDEHFQNKCWRRLRECLADGASGILATHDWTAVLKLCREACVLDRGRIVDRGPSPVVVQRYLGLVPPQAEGGSFARELPGEYRAVSGKDALLMIPVDVKTEAPVLFGCSVESFRRGIGWEHLLHLDLVPVASGPGRYDIGMAIPALPLAPGEYSLNLFLNERSASGSFFPLDVRSWTYGNDLILIVEGRPRESVMLLPLVWSIASGAS